jgi:hypothetical protein
MRNVTVRKDIPIQGHVFGRKSGVVRKTALFWAVTDTLQP